VGTRRLEVKPAEGILMALSPARHRNGAAARLMLVVQSSGARSRILRFQLDGRQQVVPSGVVKRRSPLK
jgi:hypothetical protein